MWCHACAVRTVLHVVSALALLAAGCHASASASVNTGKKQDENLDEEGPPPQGESEAPMATSTPALLGARHDLRLAQGKKTATCACLAVGLGSPGDAQFSWDTAAPSIDPMNQLVVAVSSDGVDCPAAKPGSMGASYWGYKVSGDDVVVVVENAHLGRPITSGAIIPKPLGSGQVYIQPRDKSVPYGRPIVTGDKLCRVGNPGPTRSDTGTGTGNEGTEPEQDFGD
jgi:hypothetical protein